MTEKDEVKVAVPKSKKQERVTFYLYDENGNLSTRNKIIYSPFNTRTYGREKSEDGYRNKNGDGDARSVAFIGGVYSTEDESDIEFLDAWNRWARLSNGKDYIGDNVHKIKREKPNSQIETKTIVETIEKPTIPRVVVQSLTVDQLKQLASEWKVEVTLPDEFKGQVNEFIINLLEQSGHIN